MQPWSRGQNSFFFLQTHELQLFELLASMTWISTMRLLLLLVPLIVILLCYFYHSIMCCLPFLSSLLDWRAGKEKESFTVVCKRMSDLIWRWFRLCAWSGGLWYHYRTSFSHCQLFIIIIVIIIGVLLLCL